MEHTELVMRIMEWTALGFSLLYVLLVARQNILCWPCNLIGALLYAIVFYNSSLYFISMLQLYYFCVGVYGWISWARQGTDTNQKIVNRLSTEQWIGVAVAVPLLIFASTFTAQHFFSADFTWWLIGEHYATWVSVFALLLAAKKHIENWLFWIAANIVSIIVFINAALYGTVGLYTLFLVLSFYGYIAWRKIETKL